ncbi:tetratricopeptide repeat domain protein [Aspergillus ellipticus CBS 707.79]|uniref:ER membrane protein complex subunit 2 n=1 Tax=Aspergillus ellipticus CBS 707.79 TaxID=1448320 RepID=A0A319DHR9_9EURO|nr:tetratricopeptide repeat domain protein [Aspergillus ellipticus CBS 707.79]
MTQKTFILEPDNRSNLVATFRLAQRAPMVLQKQSHAEENFPDTFVHNGKEAEDYGAIERLLFSCLQSGDDKSASCFIEQLAGRFDTLDEKVTGLKGLFEEATAEDHSSLEQYLRRYDLLLSKNPVNLPILKRRIALLRSLSRPVEAISSLVNLLDAVPTDAEAWCELADLYQSQGMNSQAAFCLEEALLIVPNAWNVLALLGEILYSSAFSSDSEGSCQLLERSIQYFCRSVELCTDYLRGFYGLVLATSLLGENRRLRGYSQDHPPPRKTNTSTSVAHNIDPLAAFARNKLDEIVRRRSSEHKLWEFDQSELIAAKELLDRLDSSNK